MDPHPESPRREGRFTTVDELRAAPRHGDMPRVTPARIRGYAHRSTHSGCGSVQRRHPIVWTLLPRAIAVIAVILVSAACRADPPTVVPGDGVPRAIDAFSGNLQIGVPGMPLQEPIAARV